MAKSKVAGIVLKWFGVVAVVVGTLISVGAAREQLRDHERRISNIEDRQKVIDAVNHWMEMHP